MVSGPASSLCGEPKPLRRAGASRGDAAAMAPGGEGAAAMAPGGEGPLRPEAPGGEGAA